MNFRTSFKNRSELIAACKGLLSKLVTIIFFLSSLFKIPILHDRLIRDIYVMNFGKVIKVRRNRLQDFWMSCPSYDFKTLNKIKNFKIRNVVDVGANIGKYTLFFSSMVGKRGKVISIEPEPKNFEILEENTRLNALENVVLKKIACSNKEGYAKLYLNKKNPGGHSLVSKKGRENIIVRSRKLDNVIKEENIKNIDLIKIDVEGAEKEVLEGAKHILKKDKPLIIFEALNRKKLSQIKEFLFKYGYSIEFIEASNFLAHPKK